MFKADYHIHSCFSGDSNESTGNIIEKAISLKLDEIALTDHLDPDFPSEKVNFDLDLPAYSEALSRLQNISHEGLIVKRGIEIGMQPHLAEKLGHIIDEEKFDFIIGSIHCVNRTDLSEGSFFDRYSKDDAHRIYFETVYHNLELMNGISVLGHLDFIKRYGKSQYGHTHTEINYELHMDVIEEILRLAIDKGTGLEVNTSGFRYGLGHPHPNEIILKRYRELGGEIITIGSDAHLSEQIGNDIAAATEILVKTGFRYICSFSEKKPFFHTIRI